MEKILLITGNSYSKKIESCLRISSNYDNEKTIFLSETSVTELLSDVLYRNNLELIIIDKLSASNFDYFFSAIFSPPVEKICNCSDNSPKIIAIVDSKIKPPLFPNCDSFNRRFDVLNVI